jgi:hypothetical protein
MSKLEAAFNLRCTKDVNVNNIYVPGGGVQELELHVKFLEIIWCVGWGVQDKERRDTWWYKVSKMKAKNASVSPTVLVFNN